MANLNYVENFILNTISYQADRCELEKGVFCPVRQFPYAIVSCVTSVCLSVHHSFFMERLLFYRQTNICDI
jgi:hypothetical protein